MKKRIVTLMIAAVFALGMTACSGQSDQAEDDSTASADQAAEEQDEEARPELAAQIENPDQYDTILLGYPNWWGDMPMPLYTFLEEYDFSGKTIIPFTAHGGSGFSDTVSTIADLQPDAEVSDSGLSISRNDVADAESEINSWAEGLRL